MTKFYFFLNTNKNEIGKNGKDEINGKLSRKCQ